MALGIPQMLLETLLKLILIQNEPEGFKLNPTLACWYVKTAPFDQTLSFRPIFESLALSSDSN